MRLEHRQSACSWSARGLQSSLVYLSGRSLPFPSVLKVDGGLGEAPNYLNEGQGLYESILVFQSQDWAPV